MLISITYTGHVLKFVTMDLLPIPNKGPLLETSNLVVLFRYSELRFDAHIHEVINTKFCMDYRTV